MTSTTEGTSGARRYARLGGDETGARGMTSSDEALSLGRIGEFLELDFGRLFVWLRRGGALIAILAIVGALAGGAFGVFAPPRFTVATDILIDPNSLKVVGDDLYQQPGQIDGTLLAARSKLRILTSGNVLARVVKDLNLTSDTEFYDPAPRLSLMSLIGLGKPAGTASNPTDAAIAALARKIDAKADDTSFVASLRVTTNSGDKSLSISSAMVDAFRQELASAEAEAAAKSAAALNDRLDALKADASTAEQKVEAYRREHNLAASSSGELVSTQTMSQLNAQALDAQSRLIAAQSAYDALMKAGRNADSADAATSASLAAARARLADLQSQLDSQSQVYGPRHPAIQKLTSERDAAAAELDREIGRVVGAAKSAVSEARSAYTALTAKAGALTTDVFSDNAAQVTLRELERDAASKVAIYEAFLSRAREITQREQIDTSNVRVISAGLPPSDRSWPPSTPILIVLGCVCGALLGAFAAIGLGIRRDLRLARTARS